MVLLIKNFSLPKKIPILLVTTDILLPAVIKTIPINSENNKLIIEKHKKEKSTSFFVGIIPDIKVGNIGTVATIQKVFNDFVIASGICRFTIKKVTTEQPYIVAEVLQIDEQTTFKDYSNDPEILNLVNEVKSNFYSIFDEELLPPLKSSLNKLPVYFLPEVCSHLIQASFGEQFVLLNTLDLTVRLKLALTLLKRPNGGNIKKYKPIVIRTNNIMDRYSNSEEISVIEKRITAAKLPEDVEAIVRRDLKTLSRIPSFNPEYGVIYTYLSIISDMPWNKYAGEILDLPKAKEDFDKDHFGLENVKKRILEYLAVRKLCADNIDSQAPVICLVGPPGVGKTSIARSIAQTLNRPFIRVSLGGVASMSEIRGHRRTYVGAMPGRMIQAIKHTKVKNPVILLDEIDKMTIGVHGDPAAALLEVLDPSQNKEFLDHYLNVPFDLSQVMFIVTANQVNKLNPALYDRLEIIKINGYTYLEKIQIAMKHLLPKQLKKNGLTDDKLVILEDTIQLLAHHYTREAGVRDLERKIGALCRAVAVKITNPENTDTIILPIIIDQKETKEILGPLRFDNKLSFRLGRPGVTVGLVVTTTGGDTLAVESSHMPGTGKLILTGMLGDVMKESAQLAWAWVRANAVLYGIDLNRDKIGNMDVHVHFPEGAVNKDGPSAGVTIATTLMSLFLDKPVLPNVAMTGEITLQGLVLPVGGIKQKIIAAHKGGFNKIIIPHKNSKNLQDIPPNIKDDLHIILVSDMHSIMESSFEGGISLLLPEQFLKTKL